MRARRFGLVLISLLLLTGSMAAQNLEVRMRPVSAGDQIVSGFVLPEPPNANGFVLEVYDISGGGHRFIDRHIIRSFEAGGGFSIRLAAPAVPNQRFEVKQNDRILMGGTADTPAPPTPTPPAAQLPAIRVGDQTVAGLVLPPQSSAAGFTIDVSDVSGAAPILVERRAIASFDASGAFSVTLPAPLGPAQRVEVRRGNATLATENVRAIAFALRPLFPGSSTVSGVLDPAPRSLAPFYVEVKNGNVLVERKAIDRLDAAGVFTVALGAPLRSTQSVGIGPAPGAATGAALTVGMFNPKVTLLNRLFDGSRTVRGYLNSTAGVGSVRVTVTRSRLEHEGPGYLQMKATGVSEVNANGEFSITLETPLVAGQVVSAQAFSTGMEPGAPSPDVIVTDPGNWGRARAYFAGGVIFSKDRNEFSEQDMALTFAIDKGWLQRPDFVLGAEDEAVPARAARDRRLCELAAETVRRANATPDAAAVRSAERSAKQTCRITFDDAVAPYRARGKFGFRQFNTFFDARLTALPVPGTTTTTTTPGTPVPSTTDQFIESRKGALMQIGAYAPLYGPQTSWVYEGAVNALFIAPVFRFGIQTVLSDEDGGVPVNARGEPDDVFNFWGIGFGLGHQKLSGTTNQTPEIISYLHVVFGRSEAYERKNSQDPTQFVNPIRAIVEGRLKIPDTPLQVGFDASLGDQRDDIRIIFGTRFDIGELFARLRSFDQ